MKYFRQLTIPSLSLIGGIEQVERLEHEFHFPVWERLYGFAENQEAIQVPTKRMVFELVEQYRHPEGIVGLYRMKSVG